ncbi:MAG: hypothetical protein KDD92_03755 [Caldilineaceae bacterium]|nr:hypothetical protein [Caldilineaceae bacterium]
MSDKPLKRQSETTPETTMEAEGRRLVLHANYELFILMLVILQLINSILSFLIRDAQIRQIPLTVGLCLAIFLMLDAFYRLFRSPNRRRYFFKHQGYLLFLGSLPAPFAVLARVIWYYLLGRYLRQSDYMDMERLIVNRRAQTTLLASILTGVLVIELGGILILEAEAAAPGANIQSAGDALWWVLVTMATVGYGDRYPVTPLGRIVAVAIMSVGVGLFSVLTSYLARSFMRPTTLARTIEERLDSNSALAQLDRIASLLDEQEHTQRENVEQIRSQLAELEDKLTQLGHSSQKTD